MVFYFLVIIFKLGKDKFKVAPKCPSVEAKHSKAVLKLIFLTKADEICRHDYSNNHMQFIFLSELYRRVKYYDLSIIITHT